ncbi:MAG: ribosome silencing factor [Deltaproteobacteria bacterium]
MELKNLLFATDKTDPSTRSPYLNNTAPSEKNLSSANSVEEKDRTPKVLSDLILEQLQEAKALQICRIDLQGKSSLTDLLLICEGRSHLHSRGIAERVLESLKKTGIRPQGVEGEREGNWILLDYGEVILHVFHPVIRKYYDLEGLHSGSPIETWNDPA